MPVDALPWGIGFERPWALLALPPAWAFILYVRRPWWRLARRSRAARRREAAVTGLRLFLTALVVLGLAGLEARRTVREQAVVFLLDGSSSVSVAASEGAAWVRKAMGARRPGDLAGVISFGETPRVEEPVRADPVFRQPETDPGRHATDVGAALRLARALLPADRRRRVVVLTDGRERPARRWRKRGAWRRPGCGWTWCPSIRAAARRRWCRTCACPRPPTRRSA